MSELINIRDNRAAIRWKLLTSASALVLTASFMSMARAEDADRPILWIELGGEVSQQMGQGDAYVPAFLSDFPNSPAFQSESPIKAEKPQINTYDKTAQITFQPEDSDWQFVASVQYGRTGRSRLVTDEPAAEKFHASHLRLKTNPFSIYLYKFSYYPSKVDFSTTQARESQSHIIVDFKAGKDVGLGLFGPHDTSAVDLGVRFAQFTSKSSSTIHARPDWQRYHSSGFFSHYRYPNTYISNFKTKWHTFAGYASATRSFHGVGPTISWNDSLPVVGNPDATELTIDWGANAAVLFGRRKVTAEHRELGHYVHGGYYKSQYYSHATPIAPRSKMVTVPNLGGFAGISFKFPNAKVSVGYRGDFFFGAMDTGWDQAESKTVGFYGPFATISVGLGG
jgi:hypothetical protein